MFPIWYYGRLQPAPVPAPAAAPTAVDLDLIRVAYELMCASGTCGRCGAPLRPRVALDAGAGADGDWQVTVRARCRTWRRHASTASVVPDAGGLRLGPLQAA